MDESGGIQVSIPSQAGILLAVELHVERPADHQVSIPSQAGILLAVDPGPVVGWQLDRLNTLTGGHPLGGEKGGYHDGK